jgi:hypothetical protein
MKLYMGKAGTYVFQTDRLFTLPAIFNVISISVPKTVKVFDKGFTSGYLFGGNFGIKELDKFGIFIDRLFFDDLCFGKVLLDSRSIRCCETLGILRSCTGMPSSHC